jgi:hypothetical protein
VIPPTADQFILGNETAAFFSKAGLKKLKLVPVKVFQESPTLIHELGNATHSAGSFSYYVRWINPDSGGDWQIAFDCFPIGEPASREGTISRPQLGNSTDVLAALDDSFMQLYNKQVQLCALRPLLMNSDWICL